MADPFAEREPESNDPDWRPGGGTSGYYSIYNRHGVPNYEVMGYTREQWEALSPEEQQELNTVSARMQRARSAEGRSNESYAFTDLARWLPSRDDLTVDYEQSEYVDGPARSELGEARADRGSIEAQMDALRAMQDVYQSGGMTEADRARQTLARMQTGQATRAARDADLNALEARGMGGSGAALASRLSAQQAGAQGLAAQDAQMLIAAQQRALQAMQSAGALGSQARGQSFDESATRRGAIDAFNQWQTNRRQGWVEGNTDRRNQTRESRAGAAQQEFSNRAAVAAGQQGAFEAGTQIQMQQQDRSRAERDRYINMAAGAAGALT